MQVISINNVLGCQEVHGIKLKYRQHEVLP